MHTVALEGGFVNHFLESSVFVFGKVAFCFRKVVFGVMESGRILLGIRIEKRAGIGYTFEVDISR